MEPFLGMSNSGVPQIVAAERVSNGLVIKFDNGKCGFYTEALLFAKFPECDELDETEVKW